MSRLTCRGDRGTGRRKQIRVFFKFTALLISITIQRPAWPHCKSYYKTNIRYICRDILRNDTPFALSDNVHSSGRRKKNIIEKTGKGLRQVVVLIFGFVFSTKFFIIIILIGNKLSNFFTSQVYFAIVLGKQSPCLYLNPWAFSFLFFLFSPHLPGEGSDQARRLEFGC